MGIYNDYEIPVNDRWESSATVAINTDWFSSDIGPIGMRTSVKHSIEITMAATGIVKIVRTRDSIAKSQILNGGCALPTDVMHIFDIILKQGDTYNIQHTSGGTQNMACTISESSNVDT